jgi:hypothetical protein
LGKERHKRRQSRPSSRLRIGRTANDDSRIVGIIGILQRQRIMSFHQAGWLESSNAIVFFGFSREHEKPTLRITRRIADIPVEGSCTLRPKTLFRAASVHHPVASVRQ